LPADAEPGADVGPGSAVGAGGGDEVVDQRVGVVVEAGGQGKCRVEPVEAVVAGGVGGDVGGEVVERPVLHVTTLGCHDSR
jgi:hypothetical protein